MEYILSWKDKNGIKKFKLIEAKTEKSAIKKCREFLKDINYTEPFLCHESEVNKGCKGEMSMSGKWMYELSNDEIWRGEQFDTKEEAITAGRNDLTSLNKAREENRDNLIISFQVGQTEEINPAGVDVDYILENVAENTADGLEVGEDYLNDVTKEDSDELEQKLNDVLFAWMKEHKYEPDFFRIVNIEKITV